MKYGDHISSILLVLLGMFLLVNGFRLGLTFKSSIGPGFFPFIVGIFLCFFSFVLFIQAFLNKETYAMRTFWQTAKGRNQILLTLICIISFVFLLNLLGFLPASILFLFFLFKFVAHLKLWVTILGAIGSSVIAYLIFEIWLKANLPPGIMLF